MDRTVARRTPHSGQQWAGQLAAKTDIFKSEGNSTLSVVVSVPSMINEMQPCRVKVIFIQGVSGGIVNILGGGSMDYPE